MDFEKIEDLQKQMKKLMEVKVSLSKISNKIGFDENEIISLLKNAGFDNLNEYNTYLNEAHLKVLSKAYVKSIKSYYNSSSKKYFSLNQKKQKELRRFFSRFISKGFFFLNFYTPEKTLDKVLNGKLDTTLIEDYFDNIVFDIAENGFFAHCSPKKNYKQDELFFIAVEDERIFNKYKHLIKLKIFIKNLYSYIRLELQSILICHHYYIFSDEEDHRDEATTNVSFSHFMIIKREALKVIHYLKHHQKWKKTLIFS